MNPPKPSKKSFDRADTDKTAVTQSLPFQPHTVHSEKVLEALGSDCTRGLTEDEVSKRLSQYGPNRLRPPKRPSVLKIIARQIGNAMTLILAGESSLPLSFSTSLSAHSRNGKRKSLESVAAPQATVIRTRNGSHEAVTTTIAVEDVVPGDIVLLQNGDIVPADGRIIQGHISNLEADEAFLTGESLPVTKQAESVHEQDCPVGLNKLAYFLLACACVLAVIVVASTGFRHVPLSIATYAVATAVSILPASLIAVVSLTLARASTDLASRHALVRRMDAIEALAGVENVCSDKVSLYPILLLTSQTGTLTVGRMVVSKCWVPTVDWRPNEASPLDTRRGQTYRFETGSDPFYPRGQILAESDASEEEEEEEVVHEDELEHQLRQFALCASLCNQATLSRPTTEDGVWEANGDFTEIALQVAAHKLGYGKPLLIHPPKSSRPSVSGRSGHDTRHGVHGYYQQLIEHPFDSTIKRMSVAYLFHAPDASQPTHILCLLKGAVERVLERCSHVQDEPLTPQYEADILSHVETLAAQGLRVLALGSKRLPADAPDASDAVRATPREEFESEFHFVGLAGIYDPPRGESPGAVADCLRAGITPRMLTGDHPATATAIALKIGILDKNFGNAAVMTGQQFDALSEKEIDALPELPLVVARCAPETKVGDGVNDSPALKRADVGVGMGTGSDVAKQSSRIVLSDDNFSTIVRAIRKGRSVFKNLAKFLLVLRLRTKMARQCSHCRPSLRSGCPPALALGLEPTAVDAMDQAPEAFHQIFTGEFYLDLVFYGFLIGSLSLVNFVIVLWGYFPGNLGQYCNEGDSTICEPVFQARGTCFATLVIILMIHAIECKHFSKGIGQIDWMDNKFPIVYIPRINDSVFLIGGLKWEWGITFGMIAVYLACTELYKWVKRVYRRRQAPASVRGDKTLRMENTIMSQVQESVGKVNLQWIRVCGTEMGGWVGGWKRWFYENETTKRQVLGIAKVVTADTDR
ncbi:uncharacterized protein L203_102777 [Cryptococcus depauperatus CBS 7841]|uniref:Cation-transporting P-type ATPase N-terminal domain-containing protein n=1 Tax=Cryptococcus depauperatus CBS 7841 TaxID=1295531 RepID=A0AAJ8JSG3_9TREE